MVGTVQTHTEKKLLFCTVPPDRSGSLENIVMEIRRLEEKLSLLAQNASRSGTVPPDRAKQLPVSTVPPNYAVAMSTRRKMKNRKQEGVRKGVEPHGENGIIWKSKWQMKLMFTNGKLLRGTVSKNVSRMISYKYKGEAVTPSTPPSTSSTQTGNGSKKKLLSGTVKKVVSGAISKTSTSSTLTGNDNERRLLRGTVKEAISGAASKESDGGTVPTSPMRKTKRSVSATPGKEGKTAGKCLSITRVRKVYGSQSPIAKSSTISTLKKLWEARGVEGFSEMARDGATRKTGLGKHLRSSESTNPICDRPIGKQSVPPIFGSDQQHRGDY